MQRLYSRPTSLESKMPRFADPYLDVPPTLFTQLRIKPTQTSPVGMNQIGEVGFDRCLAARSGTVAATGLIANFCWQTQSLSWLVSGQCVPPGSSGRNGAPDRSIPGYRIARPQICRPHAETCKKLDTVAT